AVTATQQSKMQQNKFRAWILVQLTRDVGWVISNTLVLGPVLDAAQVIRHRVPVVGWRYPCCHRDCNDNTCHSNQERNVKTRKTGVVEMKAGCWGMSTSESADDRDRTCQ